MKSPKYLVLFGGFILYSLTGVVSKSSSAYPLFSIESALHYFAMVTILFVYALIWQLSLKTISLSLAYMCRGSIVLFSLLWARLFFAETITLNNILGALLVICGILVFAWQEGLA